MDYYSHVTMDNEVKVFVKKNKVFVKSKKPVTNFSMDAEYMFDLLASSLDHNSTKPGIRRRARQLAGMGIQQVIETIGSRL